MPKDYHKGVKLQCYIPEDLSQKLDKYIQGYNNLNSHNKMSKSDIVRIAIKEFLKIYSIWYNQL